MNLVQYYTYNSLQWHHVSIMASQNHQQLDFLFVSFQKKTSKFHITGHLWGESICIWWIPLTKGQ